MFSLQFVQKFLGLVLELQVLCWSNVVTSALHLVIGQSIEVNTFSLSRFIKIC